MTLLSTCRRTIHEPILGNLEGGPLGGRGFPSGCGAWRDGWLFLRTSFGVGSQHSFARAGEAGTKAGAAHTVAEFDERPEPAGSRDPVAASYRGENDSRSNGCTARAGA